MVTTIKCVTLTEKLIIFFNGSSTGDRSKLSPNPFKWYKTDLSWLALQIVIIEGLNYTRLLK